jgi:HAD superfamily hydrolase (TIGR01549 family)
VTVKGDQAGVKAVILDFDGVILESLDIKTKAFRELFKDYPEHLERIIRFHLDNSGISRFEKFRVIYRDYLGLPLDEEGLRRLGEAFSEFVYREILRCPFVPGAREFLERFSKHYPLFVVSATPQEELEDIVARRGLRRFFLEVHGSPPGKAESLQGVLLTHGWQPGEVVFVGDAVNDYTAARRVSIPFIARVRPGEPDSFPQDGVLGKVADLAELDRRWASLLRGRGGSGESPA